MMSEHILEGVELFAVDRKYLIIYSNPNPADLEDDGVEIRITHPSMKVTSQLFRIGSFGDALEVAKHCLDYHENPDKAEEYLSVFTEFIWCIGAVEGVQISTRLSDPLDEDSS